jgi:predicted GIY-YIG superfamily endonuclease
MTLEIFSAAMKQPCVYIMANKRNGTLYTGVTSNLPKRAYEHREGLVPDFFGQVRLQNFGLV